MRAAVFDIETTALESVGAGVMLCACVRPTATGRTRTIRMNFREEWNQTEEGFLEVEERELINELVGELAKYDLLIGHNIDAFDLPYIRGRAQAHSIPFFLNPFTYDTMRAWGRVKLRTVNNGFGKPTKSMDMIADFLGIDQLKTKIYPRAHWLNIWGNAIKREEAMLNLIDHCQKDIRMNHQIYDIVLPMDAKGSIKRWM